MSEYLRIQEEIERIARERDKEIAQLKRKADSLKLEEKANAIVQIRNLMRGFGIALDEIESFKMPKVAKPKGTLPAKYRDANGNEWSGKGPAPKWIKDYEAAGQNRSFYLID